MKIRVATPDDAEAFASIYAPFVIDSRVSFEEVAPNAVEMARRIEKILRTHPWLAVEENGSAVGFAYASVHRERPGYRWAVDTTVYLAEGQRGKGLGKSLYAALLPIVRAQRFVVAYAGIALPNEGSVALHESLGYKPVALYKSVGFKAGSWHDVGWWGLDLAERKVPPQAPIPFPELPGDAIEDSLSAANRNLR